MSNNIYDQVRLLLSNHPFNEILVGYSAGADSHVLLHVLKRLQPEFQYKLHAIHIDHRLHPESGAWALHCQKVCDDLDIPLMTQTNPNDGFAKNIEAEARIYRYEIIQRYVAKETAFVSGHHQSDQAETFLLQLMRGAGLDGLKSMPLIRDFGEGSYFRPLLHIPKAMILDYVKEFKLDYIDDPMNKKTDISRNFLRHKVIPLLQQKWPQAERSIATSANWLSEIELNDQPQEQLKISKLKLDKPSVQKRKLINFVRQQVGIRLNQKQLTYLLQDFLPASQQSHPELVIKPYILRRYNDFIVITNASVSAVSKSFKTGDIVNYGQIGKINWQQQVVGIDPQQFPELMIKPLSGESRFHPHNRLHSQTIKKLMLENKIPYWLRQSLPGLYYQDQLIAIAGIGVGKEYINDGCKSLMPIWRFTKAALGMDTEILTKI